MSSQEHHRKLERMYLSAPTNDYFRPEIEIGDATAVIRIRVREDFFHVAGAVHGAVYFKALDDAAFFAAMSLIPDVFLLTASFTTYMTRPISTGVLVATGSVEHRSSRLMLADAVLHDGDGAQIGRGNGTFMRSRIALSPELGYR